MTYIYALKCPVSGVVRYIGKTKYPKLRMVGHISKAKGHHTNHHCAHWIRGLVARGLKPVFSIIREVPDGESWQDAEAEEINAHRAAGCDLTNLTAGGDGFHDVDPDVARRRGTARRATLSDPVKREEFAAKLRVGKQTAEWGERMRRLVEAVWQDPEKKSRLMAAMHRPDALARRAEGARRRYANPELAAQHKARMQEEFQKPERRDQIRRASLQRWSDFRAKRAGMLFEMGTK